MNGIRRLGAEAELSWNTGTAGDGSFQAGSSLEFRWGENYRGFPSVIIQSESSSFHGTPYALSILCNSTPQTESSL